MSNHIFYDEENFKTICAHLITQGVKEATVDFDGSGDSGSITEVRLHGNRDSDDLDALLRTEIQTWLTSKKWHNNSWHTTSVRGTASLGDILKDATYEALERSNLDWYNNDGGYGSLTLKLDGEQPKLVLDVCIRETRTDDYTFDLTKGPLESVGADED